MAMNEPKVKVHIFLFSTRAMENYVGTRSSPKLAFNKEAKFNKSFFLKQNKDMITQNFT